MGEVVATGIPKVAERKIMIVRRKKGPTQYLMTLPKRYAEHLFEGGIRDLIVVYDGVLVVFPKTPGLTGETLIELIREHLTHNQFLRRIPFPPKGERS